VKAGNLRDRITVQRAISGDDGYGNTIVSWADLITTWADVLDQLGREKLASGRLEASRAATVRVRRSTQSLGITAADRIVARGQTWDIRSIAEVGRNREMLEFLVETGVAT
jgi:SPP1 family predicted phage head-tail adaptor